MMIEVVSLICTGGLTIEVRASPGTEFALEFFATGIGGYHVRGSFSGVVPPGGRFVTFREAPFSILDVGLSELRLGEGASTRTAVPRLDAIDHRFKIDDPFETNRVPDGPVSIGGGEK
jgi:hypothetical protein